MKTDPYLRTKGDRAGEAALSLKSNLVHISLIKVDGQQVYPAVPQAPVSEDASAAEDAGHVSGSDDSTPSELTQSDREQQPQTDETAMATRSEEHTSELQSLKRISYAVFCLQKKKHK